MSVQNKSLKGRGRGFQKQSLRSKDRSMPKSKKDMFQDKRLDAVEKKIKKLDNEIELKYIDTASITPATVTGIQIPLNVVAAGTDQSDRLGGQITMTSVQWKLTIASLTATLTPTAYRLMIVLDRQANGGALVVSGGGVGGTAAVLESTAISGPINQPYQYETKKRFKIIYDERGVLNPGASLTATTLVPTASVLQGYRKLGQTVKYDAQAGLLTSINTNSLTAVIMTDVANGLLVDGGFRVYFKDP